MKETKKEKQGINKSIYHARFCLRDLSNSIFVGLKIGVDAPDILAALRPCTAQSHKVQDYYDS